MSRFTLFFFVIISFSLASVGLGQEFSKAEAIEKNTIAESFEFKAFGHQFSIDAKNGKAQRSGGARKVNFRVPLSKVDFIDQLYFSEFDNDLFLLYTVDEGGYVASAFVRLDGKTNKLKWQANIAGINTVGILDGDRGYFAAVGFVGAIDLATGKIIWKHENLYNERYGKIMAFAVPQIEADRIIFKKSETDKYAKGNELIVDKTSGKLLDVK